MSTTLFAQATPANEIALQRVVHPSAFVASGAVASELEACLTLVTSVLESNGAEAAVLSATQAADSYNHYREIAATRALTAVSLSGSRLTIFPVIAFFESVRLRALFG